MDVSSDLGEVKTAATQEQEPEREYSLAEKGEPRAAVLFTRSC